jgi:hypothetical protein
VNVTRKGERGFREAFGVTVGYPPSSRGA